MLNSKRDLTALTGSLHINKSNIFLCKNTFLCKGIKVTAGTKDFSGMTQADAISVAQLLHGC